MKWPKTINCPRCGGILEAIDYDKDGASWECQDCRLGAFTLNNDIYFDDAEDAYTYDEVYGNY